MAVVASTLTMIVLACPSVVPTTIVFPTAVKVTPPLVVEKVMVGRVEPKLLVWAVKVIEEPETTVEEGLAATLTEGAPITVTT